MHTGTLLGVIAGGALVSYAARAGGHVLLARFRPLPPRIEQAFDAVPAAVLTTLVAPALVSKGPAEAIALVLAFVVALRAPVPVMLLVGWIAVVGLRAAFG
ncbi:AzlD family protein [Pararhizobium mangrovi]|uniref:AzlD family protein n=1 Tax=Pararhizobium mangrovi TaxID=2590452 RepID=A0A506U6T5_9HYPH|nr:AzlD domain-containing protein [Pararhizobium mangrovi]TPW29560.1 AzlD family protein [Pararhizobium mangrovi]